MRLFLSALLLSFGCALPAPSTGTPLAAHPGVAESFFQSRARQTDLVGVAVYFPADAHGTPVREVAARPALVLVPGGFVPGERYGWLGAELAQAGYVVAIPDQAGDLAFFSEENGEVARALLVHPPQGSLHEGLVDPGRIAVAGHSLGGVVAVKNALGGGFHALVLLASFPDSADFARLGRLGMPSLSLAGERDCKARVAVVAADWTRLPSPTVLAVVAGMTHYQFTDDDAPDARGCPPATPLPEAHARVVEALKTFLSAALSTPPGTGAATLRGQAGLLSVESR